MKSPDQLWGAQCPDQSVFPRRCQHRRRFLLLGLGAFLFVLAPALPALEVKSVTNKNHHITSGWMDVREFQAAAIRIMHDFPSYHLWAWRYMDGSDKVSRAFWVWFNDFEFQAPDRMILHYRINMPLLFSPRPRQMEFLIFVQPDGTLEFRLQGKVPGVTAASLRIAAQVKGRLDFYLTMDFWPLVASLLDMKRFDADMEWRVDRLAGNMKEFADQLVQSPSP